MVESKGEGNPASTDSLFSIPYSRPRSRGLLRHRLGFREGFVDAADHVEGLFRQCVALTVADHLEAADGFLQRDVLAWRAGEHLGDRERLREELLDLARAVDRVAVILAELVHAENRNDVLEFLVALQGALDATCGVVVFVADDQRIELAAGRSERIDGWIDAEAGDVARERP